MDIKLKSIIALIVCDEWLRELMKNSSVLRGLECVWDNFIAVLRMDFGGKWKIKERIKLEETKVKGKYLQGWSSVC